MQFFKSKDIKVFPCSYRGTYDLDSTESQVFDPEARMLTESNFRMAGRADETFIESFDNKCLKLTFCGYYFEINNVERDELKGKTLVIKLKEIELSNSEEDDKRITHVLSSLDNSTTVLDHYDGTEFKFTGLAILEANDNPATYKSCQPILADGADNPLLVRPCPIRGEGDYSIILNDKTNEAKGAYAISGGKNIKANGNYAVALGKDSTASGQSSIAVGKNTNAIGEGDHAEGYNTQANSKNTPGKAGAHAEGHGTLAEGDGTHAEGFKTKATGDFSHAEGSETEALGGSSHAEGNHTTASGISSHAEGWYTAAAGHYSHAEGYKNEASGEASHVEGGRAAGEGTTSEAKNAAKGVSSHAEGAGNVADGSHSHVEGQNNRAVGRNSHAEGSYCEAVGEASHASGIGTIANNEGQTVVGRYNDLYSYEDPRDEQCLFTVGDGKNNDERHNVLTVYSDPDNGTCGMSLSGQLEAQQIAVASDNTWMTLTAKGLNFKNSGTKVEPERITAYNIHAYRIFFDNMYDSYSEIERGYMHHIHIYQLPVTIEKYGTSGISTTTAGLMSGTITVINHSKTLKITTWLELIKSMTEDVDGYPQELPSSTTWDRKVLLPFSKLTLAEPSTKISNVQYYKTKITANATAYYNETHYESTTRCQLHTSYTDDDIYYQYDPNIGLSTRQAHEVITTRDDAKESIEKYVQVNTIKILTID